MKKWTTRIMLTAATLIALNACYYDNKEDLYSNFEANNCETDFMSYSNDVQVIIGTNCAVSGCHLGPNAQNGLDLSQYNAVAGIANNGELVGRITESTGALMPPGGALPNCDIEKLKAWAAAGAPQN